MALLAACGDDEAIEELDTDVRDAGRDTGSREDGSTTLDAGSRVDAPSPDGGLPDAGGELLLFPANGRLDYQLGGDYPPPEGVASSRGTGKAHLDTYSRSDGRITEDDAVATMGMLSSRAHASGLAIAQKNSAEILDRAAEMGTDFAVAEECNRYTECGDYIDVYGDHVLMIEYREGDFRRGCGLYGDTHALVLRDLNLTTPSSSSYVFDDC